MGSSPNNRVNLDQLPGIFRDPLRDAHGREWPDRRMWAEGDRAGIIRVCQKYATEDEVAFAVGASPRSVRNRMRRFGVTKWPKPSREKARSGGAGHQRG